MHPEKIEIFIDDQLINWSFTSKFSSLKINENQKVKVKIYFSDISYISKTPRLDVEDHSIQLHRDESNDEMGRRTIIFSSSPEKIFRESFGIAFLRLYIEDEEFSLPFEVLATKLTAIQAERMIRYLIERREHIIRVCLSRTMRPAGMKDDGWSDPETVLSTAEKIIDTLLECRGELRKHIRSKLIPEKVPAWKMEKSGYLIDPVDVIFNIDSLRPADGRQDVVLRGRTYSTSAIDVTALVRNTNVEENSILIGGLYSIRRVISGLMDDIRTAFTGLHIPAYDKEYVQLGEVLMKLTGGAMYERCERLVSSTENIIRMMENELGIIFSGEIYPKITPYVRSSRLYRNIFEKYTHWYDLGTPSIEGDLSLIKLRSLSKIFEFFVLFRLFDYLEKEKWEITESLLSEEFYKLIPDYITFGKDDMRITLSYEPNVYKFSNQTQHMDLVKINNYFYPGKNWNPDYTMRIESISSEISRYIILDAKYSNPYWIENTHLHNIYDKYYSYTAVFDNYKNVVSKNEILGVFAIFPEPLHQIPKIVSIRYSNFCQNNNEPTILPMAAGLPISFETDKLMEIWLGKAIQEAIRSIKFTPSTKANHKNHQNQTGSVKFAA